MLPVLVHGAGHILGWLVPIFSRPLLNLFIQTYDYTFSLHKEWIFLRRSRWTKVKALYIITRYIPIVLIAVDLYLNLTPNQNPNKCHIIISIYSYSGLISLTCSECMFVLRTYALWNRNRILLVAMLSALVAVIGASSGIRFANLADSNVTTSAIPGIAGCYWTSRSIQFSIAFILLFVFQLGLVSLTLIHVIQSWRMSTGHLYAILVNHNIFYYACGLFLSAGNILVPILISDPACYSLLDDLQVCIIAILATRMHLHLWHTDQHAGYDTDALVWVSLSDMSPGDLAP
ncbi:hypothetical protein DEU56DRAFT_980762 [Suillus clintonianus]|uniref:uncharacterized protein n=1 Tax=Suillus clintonianus TaxID=1904413 RepID=UPI001B887189|nr:uncharacterized protein DEU56DRAFT_980762 [Suillus clintonianus]KAG2137033.1 hypothetical protein DEU56DRAFT_980762 [Suillus clintonianus]